MNPRGESPSNDQMIAALFLPWLDPDEKLLWSGKPQTKRFIRAGSYRRIAIILGIGIGCAALGVAAGAYKSYVSSHVPSGWYTEILNFTAQWAVWSSLLAVVLVFTRNKGLFPILPFWRLGSLAYALTDRHAMVFDREYARQPSRMTYDMILRVSHARRLDGSGYIRFEPVVITPPRHVTRPELHPSLIFDEIDDVASVLKIATEARDRFLSQPIGS